MQIHIKLDSGREIGTGITSADFQPAPGIKDVISLLTITLATKATLIFTHVLARKQYISVQYIEGDIHLPILAVSIGGSKVCIPDNPGIMVVDHNLNIQVKPQGKWAVDNKTNPELSRAFPK